MNDQATPVPLTLDNIPQDLPSLVRKSLAYATELEIGTLIIALPDGRRFIAGGKAPGPNAELIVHDFGFAQRLIREGDIGIGEAYLAKEWDTPDLTAFLQIFAANHHMIERMVHNPFVRVLQRVQHWLNRNTKSGSRRNIHAHYDLGNRFYSSWLDRTMTYSSALYAEGDNDLSSAQRRKYKALADAIDLKAEHHVLEIGCGWGGFAEYAAGEIGCRVTGLTISQEQYDFAVERMARAGLSDRVTIKLQDYRDETGLYDRIASIEMFEAVGEEYWSAYFEQLATRLKEDGRAGLQVITIQDRFFQTYRREIDFIRRYIFPGGMLPSPQKMTELGRKVGLALEKERIFGLDYARTLAEWRGRFHTAWPELTPMGFDERFRRMWDYYLSYCEAGFRTGNIDVRQLIYTKTR